MGRLIDEEDAINAILREYNKDDTDFPTDYQQGLHVAKKIIEQLPSAQPNLQQTCNQLATDCISRKMAIDAVSQALKRTFVEHEDIARTIIGKLPSAQPDIIFCKDCIKHRPSGLCEGWSRYGTITTRDDGWCAWAERRKDGKN